MEFGRNFVRMYDNSYAFACHKDVHSSPFKSTERQLSKLSDNRTSLNPRTSPNSPALDSSHFGVGFQQNFISYLVFFLLHELHLKPLLTCRIPRYFIY